MSEYEKMFRVVNAKLKQKDRKSERKSVKERWNKKQNICWNRGEYRMLEDGEITRDKSRICVAYEWYVIGIPFERDERDKT